MTFRVPSVPLYLKYKVVSTLVTIIVLGKEMKFSSYKFQVCYCGYSFPSPLTVCLLVHNGQCAVDSVWCVNLQEEQRPKKMKRTPRKFVLMQQHAPKVRADVQRNAKKSSKTLVLNLQCIFIRTVRELLTKFTKQNRMFISIPFSHRDEDEGIVEPDHCTADDRLRQLRLQSIYAICACSPVYDNTTLKTCNSAKTMAQLKYP